MIIHIPINPCTKEGCEHSFAFATGDEAGTYNVSCSVCKDKTTEYLSADDAIKEWNSKHPLKQ